MKLRKTLAGILSAVVMLLGVGTFEHVNRNTGVQAAIETVTLKYTIASTSSVTLTSGNENGISATFKNTYTSNKQQVTKNNSATLTLSNFSNYEGYLVTGLTLSMKSNSKAGSGSLSVNLGGETIYSFDAKPFNDKLWNGAYTQSFTDIKYTDFKEREIKSSDSLTITIAATVNSIYIESYTIEFSKESSGPFELEKPTNLSINDYTGIATWDSVTNASGYNCIIDNDETNPIFVSGTSYQLENGQTIKVCSVGDGTNYLNSGYSDPETYEKIPVTSTIQSWISPYFNNGVYTKKSEIHLSKDADFELSDVIHHDEKQPISLDRTTYYNGEALFMSNLDGSIGGDGQINSGYKTEGSDLRHFTLNSNNKPVNDWKVSNTSLKKFFVTLDKFMGNGYFDNWTLSATEATFAVNESNKNSETVKDFIAFAAPCLENIFDSKFANYFQLDRLTISVGETNKKSHLTLRVYLDKTAYDLETKNGTVDNSDCLLSEARIYAENEVFDEYARNVEIKAPAEGGSITCDVDITKPVKLNTVITFTITVYDDYELTALKINTSDKLDDALEDGQVQWTVKADVTVSLAFTSTLVTEDIIFEFGANKAPGHSDNNTSQTTYTETVNGYTLSISNGTNMYLSSNDEKGNSCIKLGSSSKVGSFSFTVPDNVTEVIIYVAKYKTNATNIKVNEKAYTITTSSNDGLYTAITVDTSITKTVNFTTVSGGVRCMINSIQFIAE